MTNQNPATLSDYAAQAAQDMQRIGKIAAERNRLMAAEPDLLAALQALPLPTGPLIGVRGWTVRLSLEQLNAIAAAIERATKEGA